MFATIFEFFSSLPMPTSAAVIEAMPVIVSLIIIEGLLSVDNALAIAAMANHLPGKQKYMALKLGIIGAYFFRGSSGAESEALGRLHGRFYRHLGLAVRCRSLHPTHRKIPYSRAHSVPFDRVCRIHSRLRIAERSAQWTSATARTGAREHLAEIYWDRDYRGTLDSLFQSPSH